MIVSTEILQATKEVVSAVHKDPRVALAINITQRVNNALSIYKSHSSLKGIQKQESHKAKVRKIKQLLKQHLVHDKKLPSETREKRLAEYASFCFLLEGFRMGVSYMPVIDAVSIVGTSLLSCAEEKKIERLLSEEHKEKTGWELAKARCRQLQYGLAITSKVLLLVSTAVLASTSEENLDSGSTVAIASKTQNLATALGIVMTAVSTYENREQIASAFSSIRNYISKKIHS